MQYDRCGRCRPASLLRFACVSFKRGKRIRNSIGTGIAAIFLLTVNATAQAAESGVDRAGEWPVLLRRDLARVAHIEWRLRSAAGLTCPRQAADAGVMFDDRRAYERRDWPLLETMLGMKGDPVVISVAPGSPADLAGLREGDEVIAVGGSPIDAIMARRKAGALVADALLEEIADTAPDAALAIDIRRSGTAQQLIVRPVRHCAARMVLFTDRKIDAHSDQRNVAISTGMVAFAQTDDRLALAAGHELAHVIHGDRAGGGLSARRRMEDAADELGLRLMECAGYDRDEGLGLFERLGKRDWLGFLRAPTHRSWSARVASLRAMPRSPSCPVVRK